LAALRIPEVHKPALRLLARMDGQVFTELAAALRAAVVASRARMTETLAPKVSSLSEAELDDILDCLISLNSVKEANEVPIEKFVDDVCDAMKRTAEPEEISVTDRIQALKERLSMLLPMDSIAVASKVWDLKTEVESVFDGARVLTDLRPVFGTDAEKDAKGAIVLHNLKIDFWRDGQMKSFYIALDDKDVADLRKVLDRAETKGRTLRAMLNQAKLTSFD
jgi:hypothetical protein